MAANRHVFGPVPSRRLGRSLGVDLVPLKTCTYDCIYCQLGRTTQKTVERREWVPLEEVLQDLREGLARQPDYVTLSGSGEPTLFSRLDELIDRIKSITDVPVAVLTNGALLWQEDVRRQLAKADLVMPSLDAGNPAMFRVVNRPHRAISFEQMLQGLITFRREFSGQYWLEVFLLGAYNIFEDELAAIRACVARIAPDRVLLNTVTRPPAEPHAIAVSHDRLAAIASTFSPRAEVLVDLPAPSDQAFCGADRQDILGLLARRPCTAEQIAVGLGLKHAEVLKHVQSLISEGLLESADVEGKAMYRPARGPEL